MNFYANKQAVALLVLEAAVNYEKPGHGRDRSRCNINYYRVSLELITKSINLCLLLKLEIACM